MYSYKNALIAATTLLLTLTSNAKGQTTGCENLSETVKIEDFKYGSAVLEDSCSIAVKKAYAATVEQMPCFPGGMEVMQQWLSENFVRPDQDPEIYKQGNFRVAASFIVERDGTVKSVALHNYISPLIYDAVIKVLTDMPVWQPGRRNGTPVRFIVTIFFNVMLNDGNKNNITQPDATHKHLK